VALRTPLLEVPALAAIVGVPVALKCESAQPIGVFKIRGAYNAIARLAERGGARGVVTQSSGNHAQAVAFAARQFGLRAVVVMPESTPSIKVEGVRRHGGEVVFAGRVRSPEQLERAEAIAASEGLVMIPPFDHPDVVAGQGTVGLEILEQRPDVETILVPVSGGGLLAGICVAVQALAPQVEVVAVEPAGAAKLSAALAAGEPRTLEHTESLADGLGVYWNNLFGDAERGQLVLTNAIQPYLPADIEAPTRSGRGITLTHLASHTSGLPSVPANLVIWETRLERNCRR
jgi:threonine dehydratase